MGKYLLSNTNNNSNSLSLREVTLHRRMVKILLTAKPNNLNVYKEDKKQKLQIAIHSVTYGEIISKQSVNYYQYMHILS